MKIKLVILIIFAVSIISCGKKGKLYLPDETQQQEKNGDKNEEK